MMHELKDGSYVLHLERFENNRGFGLPVAAELDTPVRAGADL